MNFDMTLVLGCLPRQQFQKVLAARECCVGVLLCFFWGLGQQFPKWVSARESWCHERKVLRVVVLVMSRKVRMASVAKPSSLSSSLVDKRRFVRCKAAKRVTSCAHSSSCLVQ